MEKSDVVVKEAFQVCKRDMLENTNHDEENLRDVFQIDKKESEAETQATKEAHMRIMKKTLKEGDFKISFVMEEAVRLSGSLPEAIVEFHFLMGVIERQEKFLEQLVKAIG
jgi:hypothetical protein